MSGWRFDHVLESVSRVVDGAGVAVTVVGIAWALVVFALRSRRMAADDVTRAGRLPAWGGRSGRPTTPRR